MRTSRALSIVSVVLLVGCTVPAAQVSQAPAGEPTATPSATPSPTASPMPRETSSPVATPTEVLPTASSSPSIAIHRGDTVEITVNGLAARPAPSISAGFVSGYAWDPATFAWTEFTPEMRLNAGDQVFITLGPLFVDGVAWYRGAPVDPQISWNRDGGGHAWLAGWTSDDGAYLRPIPGSQTYVPPPLLLVAQGEGSDTSPEFQPLIRIALDWAVAAGANHCTLRIVLMPAGVELVAVDVAGFDEGLRTWPEGPAPELPEVSGTYWLDVTAGEACSWAVAVSGTQN